MNDYGLIPDPLDSLLHAWLIAHAGHEVMHCTVYKGEETRRVLRYTTEGTLVLDSEASEDCPIEDLNYTLWCRSCDGEYYLGEPSNCGVEHTFE